MDALSVTTAAGILRHELMNALEMAIELFDLQGVWFQYIELSVWHAHRRNITALSLCNCIWHATCLVAYAHQSAALFTRND
jgi:hypothetical protein